MPEIIVKLGDKVVQKILLMQNQRLTIGRAPDNDISIENPAVSRRHTAIQQISGRFILEDLNSANGTYVNGVRVSKTEILDKDVITIGKHKLHFYNEIVVADPQSAEDQPATTAPRTALLRVTQGKQRDQVFELTKVETTIGRAQENDVRLHDWFVSKFHAVIGRRGAQFIIRDLDSWRHTMVNGEAVQERALQNGDEIMFGPKIAMRFELQGAEGLAPEGSGRRPVELEGAVAVKSPAEWDSQDGPMNRALAAVDEEHAPEEGATPAPAQPKPAFLEGSASDEWDVKVDDFELGGHPPAPKDAPQPAEDEYEATSAMNAEAPPPPPAGTDADPDEVAMWEKALQNPSKVIRKQAARALKKLTGRDYDIE